MSHRCWRVQVETEMDESLAMNYGKACPPPAPSLLGASPKSWWQRAANEDIFHCYRRVQFETDTFKGCAVLWVQGLANAPPDLFANRARKTSLTVQGVFKRPCGLDDVCTGQEFSRTPVNLPAKWLVESVLIKVASLEGIVP